MRRGRLLSSSKKVGVWAERVPASIIKACAWASILALVLIFVFIGKEALPIFTSAEVREETDVGRMIAPDAEGRAWQPVSTKPKYWIIPLLLGTLKATVVAMVIAIPLAVGAALFTSEFAPRRVREFLKPIVEILAGIPSVVVGFFCILVLAGPLQDIFGWTFRLNAMTAGIGLSLAVIPIVYTVSEDALTAVPRSFREASISMGATNWQTAWRVVLPAASPGVFAACILGFGRAIGETMIVLMASGNAAVVSVDPTDSLRTVSATIAAELGEVVVGSAHYHVLFFLGALLFLLTFLTNLAGHWWVGRMSRRLRGEVAYVPTMPSPHVATGPEA